MATEQNNTTTTLVVSVGSGGRNAIDYMYENGMDSAAFLKIDTDLNTQACHDKPFPVLIIGKETTRGYSARGDIEIGKKAAEEAREEIKAALKGADLVILVACMGGGTGTGAAPIIAEITREMGILTIGVVTKPYGFEGKQRAHQAQEGIDNLKEKVDSLLVIPNERLRAIDPNIALVTAFDAADKAQTQAVQSITNLINNKGIINLDFVDFTLMMKDSGLAYMGLGRASGEGKAEKVAREAIVSPLLEAPLHGARGVIVSFRVPPNIDIREINTASAMIHDAASEEANLIWGVVLDEEMGDTVCVTIIATGFEEKTEPADSVSGLEQPPATSIVPPSQGE